MADTKWTKGSGGNWNDAANWDNGVPDSSKNAIFDAASFSADGNTVTINAANCACANLDFSAIDQTVTFANSTYTDFKVYGNLVLHATKLTWSFTGTGYVTLAGTGSQTITTNGMTSNMNRLYFDGVGGTWTNQDACNLGSSNLYLTNGTWDTNGQTITTTGSFYTATGTNGLNITNTTFNCASWYPQITGGLTFTSTGSTINVNNGIFYGKGLSYNDVNINTTSLFGVYDSSTFVNLTITGGANILSGLNIGGNNTISGILTLTGNNSTNYRLLVASSAIGTQRTITAASISASNVDFRDIKLAGACDKDLSAITGGSGDCGGNTDITFSTPETKYYKHTSGACTWKDVTKWRTSSGDTLGSNLLSGWDFTSGWTTLGTTSIIDNNSFSTTDSGGIRKSISLSVGKAYKIVIAGTTSSSSITIKNYANVVTYTSIATGAFNTTVYVVISIDDGLHIRNASTGTTDITTFTCEEVTNVSSRIPLPQDSAILDANSFTGTSTLTIDVPRKGSVDMSAVNQAVTTSLANAVEHYGNLILGNNITPSGNYMRTLMGRGSYSLNLYGKTVYDVTVNAVGGTYTFASGFVFRKFTQINGTIVMGSYTYESNLITADTAWTYTAGTVTPETSTIKLNPASGSSNITFAGGGNTYNNVWFSGSHTGYFDITGSNTFNELKIEPGRKVRVTAGTTQTVSKLNATGTQASPITIQSVTNAVHDLALASGQPNPQCDWLILHNSRCNVSFYAGNGSANVPSMGNGLLYNWYAVNDAHGLAPAGCHIPTDAEWTTLSTYLGGTSVAGGKLKSINSIFWTGTNVGADNSSGFTALGSGYRDPSGTFGGISRYGYCWSSTEYSATNAWYITLNYNAASVVRTSNSNVYGFSVRCICDTPYYLGQVITDVDGNRYGTVLIGTQTWLTSNLKTTKYADGTAIPNVTDNSAWAALTTGAYCSYNNAAIVEYPANNTNWVLANQSKGMLNFF